MTDIKSRLVDGMRGQGIRLPDGDWLRIDDNNLGLIADRLLRTPGIAIVALPEPDEVLKNRAVFHAAPYRVVAITGGEDQGFVDLNNTHLLYGNAQSLAAALLAAAVQAQEPK